MTIRRLAAHCLATALIGATATKAIADDDPAEAAKREAAEMERIREDRNWRGRSGSPLPKRRPVKPPHNGNRERERRMRRAKREPRT